jgi:peptide/nickel transport system substrate-binding protein
MKKVFLLLMVVTVVLSMVAAFSLVGCKTTTTETTAGETTAAVTTAAAETTATTEKPVEFKDEIVSVSIVEPKSFDPIFGGVFLEDEFAYNLFYDSLVKIENGNLVPNLAESYTISDSGLEVVLKLRKGIKFHDGTDFNANAVKWNLDRERTDSTNFFYSQVQVIKDVVVVDEYTVKIILNEVSASILSALGSGPGLMVSPTAAEKFGEDFGQNPVGTGPYKFVQWTVGDRVTGERFKDYWRKDKDGIQLPYSDKATVRFIAENSVAMIELQSGNVDIIENNIPSDFKTAAADPNLQMLPSGVGTPSYVIFNCAAEPFSNEQLRHAFSAAIDRETLMQVITLGYGEVTPTLIPSSDWVYDKDLKNPYPYNPELAKTLLAEAGYPDGIEVTFDVIQRDPDVQIAELLQAQLKEVGIKLNIEVLDRQAWLNTVNGDTYTVGLLRTTMPHGDFDLFAKSIWNIKGTNFENINDPELFGLLDKAGKILDFKERYDYYAEFQQLMLDHTYDAYLFIRPLMVIATKNVIEFSFSPCIGLLNPGETKVVK